MKTSKIFQIQTVVTLFVTTLCVPLRTDVIPKEYNLEIIVNLGDEDDKFNFKGMVSIAVSWRHISTFNRCTICSKYNVIPYGTDIKLFSS